MLRFCFSCSLTTLIAYLCRRKDCVHLRHSWLLSATAPTPNNATVLWLLVSSSSNFFPLFSYMYQCNRSSRPPRYASSPVPSLSYHPLRFQPDHQRWFEATSILKDLYRQITILDDFSIPPLFPIWFLNGLRYPPAVLNASAQLEHRYAQV